MEAIDLETTKVVSGGLTLAGFFAALALCGPVERGVSAGEMFDGTGD